MAKGKDLNKLAGDLGAQQQFWGADPSLGWGGRHLEDLLQAYQSAGRVGSNVLESSLMMPQQVMDAILGDVPIRDKRGKVVKMAPAPERKKFSPELQGTKEKAAAFALDLLIPGPGGEAKTSAAALFAIPNLTRAAKRELASGVSGNLPEILKALASPNASTRNAAAMYLQRARGSILKKGTQLGDLLRGLFPVGTGAKLGESVAPGKIVLSEARDKALIKSSARPSRGIPDVELGTFDIEEMDLATLMDVLGHEVGHVFEKAMRKAAKTEDKTAKETLSILEAASLQQPWRAQGSTMWRAVTKAGTTPAKYPHGKSVSERTGEELADFLTALTSAGEQQKLTPDQRDLLSQIMQLY